VVKSRAAYAWRQKKAAPIGNHHVLRRDATLRPNKASTNANRNQEHDF
jgi:hypothetical protein